MKEFLQWRGVGMEFEGTPALDGISLSVDEGEVLGILGPSGSGKSTLLRITAGLETATSGRVMLEGRDLAGVPTHQRDFGLMFQEYCLFPHLSVEANVGFGLRMKGWGSSKRRRRVREMLQLVRLSGFGRRDVLSLSGGEQQRVALARSLAPSPRLLMLDEPLGSLDTALRGSLISELAEILGEVGVTALYVTHDHKEAMTVSGRIALLNAGKLSQVGSPRQLVDSPANAFVASFLGLGAMVPGALQRKEGKWVFESEIGVIALGSTNGPSSVPGRNRSWKLLIRPQAVRFTRHTGLVRVHALVRGRMVGPGGSSARIALKGKNGSEHEVECALSGAENDGKPMLPRQGAGTVWIDPRGCRALPDES
jgi:thiamine transport system ATP-binding protein